MRGYVAKTIYNKGYPFGFIQGDDGNSYYFDSRSLPDGFGMSSFFDNDCVEFDPIQTKKGLTATNVIQVAASDVPAAKKATHSKPQEQQEKKIVQVQANPPIDNGIIQFYRSGFAKHFDFVKMNQCCKPGSGEAEVLRKLSEILYISYVNQHNMGHENYYPYCLLGTTEILKQFVRDKSEFLLVFSHFKSEDWQQNTLKVASQIRQRKEIADRRPRVNFYILVSNALTLKEEINKVKGGTEAAVIPFTFSEILKANSGELRTLILNRFDEYYFENNMFGEVNPIEEEALLFGDRGKIADTIVDRVRSRNHSGIFGLRRSGKSSVLQAVIRRLKYNEIKYIHIQARSFLEELDSWKTALYDIAREIRKTTLGLEQEEGESRKDFTLRLNLSSTEEDYEKRATQCFVDDVKHYTKGEIFVIAIDEIELITYNTASSNTWRDLDAYKGFWGALRDSECTLILCGVNSIINESSHLSFQGKECDNPMYERIHLCADSSKTYLPAFTDEQTKYMINQLGSYSNVAFNNVFTEINNAFGGQPFAIRQFCAFVFDNIKDQRLPHEIYEVSKASFNVLYADFCHSKKGNDLYKTILQHLKKTYEAEYSLLCSIALNPEKYKSLDQTDITSIDHLEKYGLIEYDHRSSHLAFRIHAIQEYIVRTNNKAPQDMSNDERREYVQRAVAECERKLKNLVLRYYVAIGQTAQGKQLLTQVDFQGKPIYVTQKDTCPNNYTFKDLFDHNKFIMYFSTLKRIICDNWNTLGCALNNYGISKKQFIQIMDALNAGRTDADHYDAEDLTSPEQWEIDDLKMSTFTAAYEQLKGFFDDNSL